MKILITGCAGFIGSEVALHYLLWGHDVCGVDNLNKYYDINLKQARLSRLKEYSKFQFFHLDLKDNEKVKHLFEQLKPQLVIHLAAQAGVRYGLINPQAYLDSNLQGFLNILEGCRHFPVEHLVFASSSSVYGSNSKTPFSEEDSVDHPLSLYAASKKANELMAHAYSENFNIPLTGLRFFSVYGPFGRPDMAYFSFTQKIILGEKIELYNSGKYKRDFTYINDVVKGVTLVAEAPPRRSTIWPSANKFASTSLAPYRIYNLGNSCPIEMRKFVKILESIIGKKANFVMLDVLTGEVPETYADMSSFEQDFHFQPQTTLEVGLDNFFRWYKSYYNY